MPMGDIDPTQPWSDAHGYTSPGDSLLDHKELFRKSVKINSLIQKALSECQLLLCPDFGTCADKLKEGEKCACGFEDGPFANAVPKNRAAK